MPRFTKDTSNIITKRREELKHALMLNKLVYKDNGNMYSYVHYGKPDINEVINSELESEKKKLSLHMKLKNRLEKVNISYRDNMDFINSLLKTEKYTEKHIDILTKETEINNFLNNMGNGICKKKCNCVIDNNICNLRKNATIYQKNCKKMLFPFANINGNDALSEQSNVMSENVEDVNLKRSIGQMNCCNNNVERILSLRKYILNKNDVDKLHFNISAFMNEVE